jgi:hypothetical protein
MKNKSVKNTAALTNSQSWPWYKVWANALFHPSVKTGEAILFEGNISLRQAILWLVFSSFVQVSSNRLTSLIKNPSLVTWQNIFKLISDILFSSLSFPLILFFFCWLIHLIAKLFRSKGTLQNFFILNAAFAAPLWIILGLVFAGAFILKIDTLVLVGAPLEFYWLIVVNSIVIKSVYCFSWRGTCSITALIMIVGYILVLMEIYFTFSKHLH